MTKPDYIINNNTNHIIYYCTNHRLNTTNKKLRFGKSPCDGQIKYIIKENKFYKIYSHNKICDNIKEKVNDNLADINDNITKFSNFKKNTNKFFKPQPLD